MSTPTMIFTSKIGTEQLRNAISNGKFEGEELVKAQASLAKRDAKPSKTTPVVALPEADKKSKKTEVKKEKKKPEDKKAKTEPAEEKAPKEKTEAEIYPKGTISGLVRRMLKPKDDTLIAGCTYGEASKAVEKKFGRALHASEFDRSFKFLEKLGIVKDKRPRFKQDPADTTEQK